ncbi:MAG: ChbG/HpnK family deacetylase [Gemmatimonadota bacterium]|nr:ChbG/HpnK family deacetylase [Gemmatimonadota bacterium]
MVRVGSTHRHRRLIVNADDYGLSGGVNTGIIEAAERGVVTSTSMMVNLAGFDDAVTLVRSARSLSVGLHFNLTTGKPLTTAASLARPSTGAFYPLTSLLTRASLGLIHAAEVRQECVAQIDRLLEAGIQPTHIDSHRHVHAHPVLWTAVLEAGASRNIHTVRVPSEPLWANPRDWRASLKKIGLLIVARLSRQQVRHNFPDHFFGISLQGGRSFASRLFGLIPKLPPGTSELMTHPGYSDSALAEHDDYTWQREEELTVLCSTGLRDLLERSDIELVSFGDQPSHRTTRVS